MMNFGKPFNTDFARWSFLQAFASKYRLPFTLLSDEGNKVRKQWGVPSDLFGTLPGRETYVIDKKGIVQLVYNNQFQPEKHVDETLKLLQSLWGPSQLLCIRSFFFPLIQFQLAKNFVFLFSIDMKLSNLHLIHVDQQKKEHLHVYCIIL